MSLLNVRDLTKEQLETEIHDLINELERRADNYDIYNYEIDTRRHYIHWSASAVSC